MREPTVRVNFCARGFGPARRYLRVGVRGHFIADVLVPPQNAWTALAIAQMADGFRRLTGVECKPKDGNLHSTRARCAWFSCSVGRSESRWRMRECDGLVSFRCAINAANKSSAEGSNRPSQCPSLTSAGQATHREQISNPWSVVNHTLVCFQSNSNGHGQDIALFNRLWHLWPAHDLDGCRLAGRVPSP